MNLILLILIIVLGYNNERCESAKILGIFNHPSKSHTFLGNVLFEELAKRGHQVVFVNGFASKKLTPNFTNIIIEGIAQDLISRDSIYFKHKHDQHRIIKESIEMSQSHLISTFENAKIRNLIENGTSFDLVVSDYFYNDANFIFGHIFKAPIVVLSSFGNTLATTHLTGNFLPFSYVPGCSLQHSDEMSLWERLKMTVHGLNLLRTIEESQKKHGELLKKYFRNPPSMRELHEKIALVLTNSHYSFETVRPITPNVVPIGGFHVQKPKDLPEDVEQILDSARDGVILFSLGTQIKSSNIKLETLNLILNAFSSLNQTVLWKFERSFENIPLPENVLIKEWLSQSDILAHPNSVLFITHGGSLSVIESLHYGVPMLVIPFNGDQHMNSKFIENRKIGKLMNLENLQHFEENLKEMLANPIYKTNTKLYSRFLKEQPMKPLETAMFWIEHVISHGGGQHLRPASLKLSWLQYNLADVYSILLAGIIMSSIIISAAIYNLFRVIFKIACMRKIEKTKES